MKTVIELYHDHGTCEQYHSEIKTDMDFERLQSGKFQTNNLILHLAIIAYNILRLMGQKSLKLKDVPLRKTIQEEGCALNARGHACTKIYLNLGSSNA